jgi:hypothetical protein
VGAGRADIVLQGLVIKLKLNALKRGIQLGAKCQALEFRAIVLSCDPKTGYTQDCLLPWTQTPLKKPKTEPKTDLEPNKTEPNKTEPNTKNDCLFNAVRTKYKAALAAGTWIDTAQLEAHLRDFLKHTTTAEGRGHKQKVDSFLRKNFKFATQSRNSPKRLKRARVCFPKSQ